MRGEEGVGGGGINNPFLSLHSLSTAVTAVHHYRLARF